MVSMVINGGIALLSGVVLHRWAANRKRKKTTKTQHFRAGTGAVILNHDLDKVLIFKRTGSNSWQFPQGGLDVGEAPIDGVVREIWEETGISKTDLELLPIKPQLLAYEFPARRRNARRGRGQTQLWHYFKFVGDSNAITLGNEEVPEFDEWQWTTMDDAVDKIVGFKKEVYTKLRDTLSTWHML